MCGDPYGLDCGDKIVNRLMMLGIYHIPEHMGIRFRDEGMFVKNVLAREEALYVEHPAEEEVYKRLDGRLLVLRGPKGDGLSMVVLVALTRKMLLDRAVVIGAKVARDYISDIAGLVKLVNSIRETHREPIFYLDISKPGHYPQKPWREDVLYMPTKLDNFLSILEEVKTISRFKDVTAVVVLSDDLYEILKHELNVHATTEVSSGDMRFLRELAHAYNNCGEDVAAEVAEAVTKEYDCGRAVLTTLAADWLARRGCQGTITEALQAAEDKAKELIINYIWYTVLSGNRPYANLHAPLILLRHFEGPMSAESAEEFLISLGFEMHKVVNSTAVKWLAVRHCNLIESAVKKAVETALTKRIDEQPYNALRSAAVDYYKHFKTKGYFQ